MGSHSSSRTGGPAYKNSDLLPPRHQSTRLEFEAVPINILLVDDEPKNLVALETILDDGRYQLLRAASADEALLLLVKEEFALIVLDIHMPGMSGLVTAHQATEKDRLRADHFFDGLL